MAPKLHLTACLLSCKAPPPEPQIPEFLVYRSYVLRGIRAVRRSWLHNGYHIAHDLALLAGIVPQAVSTQLRAQSVHSTLQLMAPHSRLAVGVQWAQAACWALLHQCCVLLALTKMRLGSMVNAERAHRISSASAMEPSPHRTRRVTEDVPVLPTLMANAKFVLSDMPVMG